MNSVTEESFLIGQIIRMANSRNASSLFLNGPPGIGKSYFLSRIARALPKLIARCNVLGPYVLGMDSYHHLNLLVSKDLVEAGYIDDVPNNAESLKDLWDYVDSRRGSNQTIVILVDIPSSYEIEVAELGQLFSAIRALEGERRGGHSRLIHIVSGFWDDDMLRRHFHSIQVSFPYTLGYNYFIIDGVSPSDLWSIVKEQCGTSLDSIHLKLLHEMTHGYPQAVVEIVGEYSPNVTSITTLLESTLQTAKHGYLRLKLLNSWNRMLGDADRNLLSRMLHAGKVESRHNSHSQARLVALGLARWLHTARARFLAFRSWYIELIVRHSAIEMHLEGTPALQPQDMMPILNVVNGEAYRLIQDIEIHTRNFVMTWVAERAMDAEDLLSNIDIRYDRDDILRDASQRAGNWQQAAAANGVDNGLNPLIAFTSTRDLARIIREIAQTSGLRQWGDIADKIYELAPIRDAVMHNQMISDHAFERLYSLQESVYRAMDPAI